MREQHDDFLEQPNPADSRFDTVLTWLVIVTMPLLFVAILWVVFASVR